MHQILLPCSPVIWQFVRKNEMLSQKQAEQGAIILALLIFTLLPSPAVLIDSIRQTIHTMNMNR